jgi:lipid II:glycine glycyltransferase (peptidoglycan interpeptide bridge formation enzyme)
VENKYTISEITEKNHFDNFLLNSQASSFLQSWNWGEFQSLGLGKKIFRLGVFDGENLVATCLCLEEQTKLGKFIYCPRGPILNWEVDAKEIIGEIFKFFKAKGSYLFVRMDPSVRKDSLEISNIFKSLNAKDAITFLQVERAWILNIENKSEEQLLSGMRIQTRYNINKCQRDGKVSVKVSDLNETDQNTFIDLLTNMSKQKGFFTHPSKYFQDMFKFGKENGITNIITAYANNTPVASAIITIFGDEACYIYGASNKDDTKLRASYLLQWESIKYAMSKGCKKYNFWGVVSDQNYHEGYPGYGYSNFKKGFGGELVEYTRAKDFVFKGIQYQGYRLLEWYWKTFFRKGN